jgi:hypothetical protein
MIVVIQCAATKRPQAGRLHTASGKPVLFVADPRKAPPSADCLYVRPDDLSDNGPSWRELVLRYNNAPGANPLGLLPAFMLYENDIYRRLVEKIGTDNTYILSAGWGLINAAFLTPDYDITFSPSAEAYKRRSHRDAYHDFSMLPAEVEDPVLFFGGRDYSPLCAEVTKSINAPKTVFYNSAELPAAPGCVHQRFETATRTNWHYECAKAFVEGSLAVASAS